MAMKLQIRAIIMAGLGLAFFLRVWGLDFGLPYAFHPDEHQYVDAALAWHTTGQMEARFINPPLFTYILIVGFWPWFALSPFEPTPEWAVGAYFLARLWSVSFGMLTVALMYPLGKRLYNRQAGLLALVLLAGLFLPAREAHFAVNDAPVTFFALLAIYLSLGVFQRRQHWPAYALTGVVIGLAAATKLTAGLIFLPLLIAHALATRISLRKHIFFREHRNLGLSFLTASATCLIVFGHIFWNLPQFINRFNELIEFGVEGFGGIRMGPATGWHFYTDVFGWGIGWLLLGAIVITMGVVIWRRQPQGLIVSIFPVALFVYMGSQQAFSARYLLPAVPPLIALVAVGLVWAMAKWGARPSYQRLVWPLLVLLLLAQPLTNLIWFDYLLTLPDTRQLATEWFTQEFPADTVVVKEFYSLMPDIVFTTKHWPYKIIALDKRDPNRNEVNYYLDHKTQVIAISNYVYDRRPQDPVAEETRQAQLAFLDEQASLIKTFDPYRSLYQPDFFYLDQLYGPASETLQRISPGPLIKIYRLPYDKQPYTLEMPSISQPLAANFADKLLLLGYELPSRRVEPGSGIPLTLYWQALTRMDKTYVVANRLLDSEQQAWGGYDRWPLETANTTLWHPGEIVVDTFNLPVAAEAPAGVYTIDIGLYAQADPQARPLALVQAGQPLDQNSVRLGPVKVGGPPPEASLQRPRPQHALSVSLGEPPTIALLGYDLATSAGGIDLILYWESLTQTPTDWNTFVHLRNAAAETVAQKDGPTGGGRYPTSLWDAGEVIEEEISLPLAEVERGNYQLVIGLYDLATGQRLTVPDNLANEISLGEQSW